MHVPDSNHFVKTPTGDIVLRCWLNEQGRAKEVRMWQNLSRLFLVDVPDNHGAVGTY